MIWGQPKMMVLVALLLGASWLETTDAATTSGDSSISKNNLHNGIFSSRHGYSDFPTDVGFFVNDTQFTPCTKIGQLVGYSIVISNSASAVTGNDENENNNPTQIERKGEDDEETSSSSTYYFEISSDWGIDGSNNIVSTNATLRPGDSHTFQHYHIYDDEDDIGKKLTIANKLQVYDVVDDETSSSSKSLTAEVIDEFDIEIVNENDDNDSCSIGVSTEASASSTSSSSSSPSPLSMGLIFASMVVVGTELLLSTFGRLNG